MPFHLRITSQKRFPWFQLEYTTMRAVSSTANREDEMQEHRRWLATLKRASLELRRSEEVELQRGCPVSAQCKAESARPLEEAAEVIEDYLTQYELQMGQDEIERL